MGQYFFILLRSTRCSVFWNVSVVNTPNILKRSKWLLVAVFLAVFSFPTVAFAIDYTLTWKANEDPVVEGYKIYFKTDSPGPPYEGLHPYYPNLDSPIDVGNVTEYTLYDLEENVVYFMTVTAYDSDGLESGFSNEVSTEDIADVTRSVWSDEGETDGSGCFIQSTK
jgi:hypothetical protein